jgi:carbamate kinase
MSCWVVPTIAAEFLGIPLEQVLDDMRIGKIASKIESGFTFVDVAPDSPIFVAPKKEIPPTYVVVSHEELVALGEAEEESDWRATRDEAEELRRPPLAA